MGHDWHLWLALKFVAEFIHLVSSEANEICKQKAKKTISPEHIIEALKVIRYYN